MATSRPSIFSIPSACKRERLRETNSRTVPICAANSWLVMGRVTSTPAAVRLPDFWREAQEIGSKPVADSGERQFFDNSHQASKTRAHDP